MRMIAVAGFCICWGIVVIASSFAQTTSTQPVAAPKQSSTHQSAREGLPNPFLFEAVSTSRYDQLDALVQIKKIVSDAKRLTPRQRSDAYEALSAIALSGTERPAVSGKIVINDFPLLRMRACREIGDLGGAKAEQTLLYVVRYDNDPVVLAEAAFQLGRLKQDPNNRVSNRIAEALRQNVSRQTEPIFAFQAIHVLERLAKSSKVPPDSTVYLAIADMGKLGYGYAVDAASASALGAIAN